MATLIVGVVSRVPRLREELLARTFAHAIEWRFVDADAPQVSALQDVEIVLADPPAIAPLLTQLGSSVRWMHSSFAGVNALFKDQSTAPSFILTRLANFGGLMSEYVIGQIIAHERSFTKHAQHQQQLLWPSEKIAYRSLRQLTLGIIGATGEIGHSIAVAAQVFGMRVHGFARRQRNTSEDKDPAISHLFIGQDQLGAFLANVDYIVSVVPSTPLTSNMLSDGILRSCSRKPVLINVGRGDIINESSILEALNQQWISHAILDVFVKEPLPSDSPLWTHSNVTITPHVSALSFAGDVVDSFEQNLNLYVLKQPLKNIIDWDQGY